MSADLKRCRGCGDSKPLTEFYPHKMMGDGHLNKCKSCVRARVKARHQRLASTDLAWVEREAERHREKSRRYVAQGRVKPPSSAKMRVRNAAYASNHPHKRKATQIVSNAIRDGKLTPQPCEVCQTAPSEAHHEDYSKPLEVRWLCKRHHMERHVEINRERRAARFASRSE